MSSRMGLRGTEMSGSRTSRARDGFTLIEVLVASSVSVVILLGIGQFLVRSSGAFSDLARRSHISARGQAIMERVANELAAGRFVTLDPPVPAESSWIRFDKTTGFTNGAPVFSNPFQIELIEEEGADSADLRVWEDLPPYSTTPGNEDSPTILSSNVAPGGLVFTRTGATLEVSITFQVPVVDSDETHTFTLASGVKMRNEE